MQYSFSYVAYLSHFPITQKKKAAVKISFGAVSLLEAVFREILEETLLDTTSEEAVPDTPPPPHLNLLQVAPPLSSSDPDEYFSMFRSELSSDLSQVRSRANQSV